MPKVVGSGDSDGGRWEEELFGGVVVEESWVARAVPRGKNHTFMAASVHSRA